MAEVTVRQWQEVKKVAGKNLLLQWLCPEGKAVCGPTLVFLHEGMGSIRQWKDYPERLVAATGLPGLVFDRCGYGGSDPLTLPRPLDYLRQEGEMALPALFSSVEVTDPILVGHSDGGSIALYYAAACPDATRAVITEAAHVFVEPETLAGIEEATGFWQHDWFRKGLTKYHGDKAETVFRSWSDTWLTPAFSELDMVPNLPRITAPVLALQGQEDQYGTEKQVTAIVEGVAGRGVPLMLPDCKHVPHLEASEATLAAMVSFLRDEGFC
ncbi:alpha/beta fold hydrolase [Rhodovibrionaceae bacterium A322]